MKKYFRLYRNFLIIFGVIVILITVASIWAHIEYSPIQRGEFSPQAWDRYPQLRHYMVEDMEVKIDIWNLSKSEIISILGTKAADIYEPGGISYLISRGFMYNEYYRIVFTNDNEKVINIYREYDL